MKLMQGDCLELLKTIPDKSVDLVLTDPPYGTTACKWDTVIPFDLMWAELNRIIKQTGTICLCGSEPFSSYLRLSNIKEFKYDWIWKKPQGTDFQLCKKKPLKDYEIISVFKGKGYSPLGLTEINRPKSAKTDTLGHLAQASKRPHIQTHSGYPKTIIEFNNERGHHPTQKPVALLEYLIKTYTLEGQTVLDFTMGSGSTGVACVNTGRAFIGIELDPKYFEIASNRILDAQLG